MHRFCAVGWVPGEGAEAQHCPVEAVAIAADERMMGGDGYGCCWMNLMKLLDPVAPQSDHVMASPHLCAQSAAHRL